MSLLLSLALVAGSALRVDAILQEGAEGVCVQLRTEPYRDYETREYSETVREWCWDITKAFRCNVIYPRWEQVPVTREREVKLIVCCDGWEFVDGFCQHQQPVHEEVPVVVVPEDAEVAPSEILVHEHEENPIEVIPEETPVPVVDEHVHEEGPLVVSLPEENPAPAVEEHQEDPHFTEETPAVEEAQVEVEEIPIVVAVPDETPAPVVEEHDGPFVVAVPEETPAVEEAQELDAASHVETPEPEVNMTDLELAQALFRALHRSSHPTIPESNDPEVNMSDLELAQTLFRALHTASRPPVAEPPVNPSNPEVFEEIIETPEDLERHWKTPVHNDSEESEVNDEEREHHWREIIKHIGMPPEEHRIQEDSEETANQADQQRHHLTEETVPIEEHYEQHWRELIKHIANAPVEQRAQEDSEANEQQHEEPVAPAHHEHQPEPHWREIIKHIVAGRPVVHEEEEPEQPAAPAAAHAATHAAQEAAAAAAETAHRAHEHAKAEQMAAEIAGIFVKEMINALPQEATTPTNTEAPVEHEPEPPVPNEDHSSRPEPLAPSLPEVQKVLEDTMKDLSETMLRSLSRLHQAWLALHSHNTGTNDRPETHD